MRLLVDRRGLLTSAQAKDILTKAQKPAVQQHLCPTLKDRQAHQAPRRERRASARKQRRRNNVLRLLMAKYKKPLHACPDICNTTPFSYISILRFAYRTRRWVYGCTCTLLSFAFFRAGCARVCFGAVFATVTEIARSVVTFA
jgi:hypothetical protein